MMLNCIQNDPSAVGAAGSATQVQHLAADAQLVKQYGNESGTPLGGSR
jgi:hypothetical protein